MAGEQLRTRLSPGELRAGLRPDDVAASNPSVNWASLGISVCRVKEVQYEEIDDVSSILSGSGASAGTVKTVTNAIVPLRDSLARSGSGSIVGTMPPSGADDGTVRL